MGPRYVRVLIIYTGVISVTGLLASWVMGFERTEIKMKSSINLFTISSDAARREKTTLMGALALTEGVSNTPMTHVIANFPRTSSMKKMSGTSIALADLSQQTTAETAAVSAAGSVETTAEGTITLFETIEKHKTETLETAKSTPGETATACTQIKETLTNTAQNTPTPERTHVSDFNQTHKSETDVGIFGKQTDVATTVPKQESGTTSFAQTTTAPNIKSATPIPELMTDRPSQFITTKLKTLKITSENKATTKTRPAITFKTAAFITERKVDLTKGTPAPTTFIKRLKTTRTEPSKVEAGERTTVRPRESTQAIKTYNDPTTTNGATGINLITTIQIATGTKEKTLGKRLSTAGAGIKIKSRRGHAKTPLSHDKTLYSAITLGCILVICSLLALIVFIMEFIEC